MDHDRLFQRARARADELPGAELGHPFGDDWDVYKVRGRVFMLLTEVTGEPIVVIKSDPDESRALRQEHPDITPGYHMNKRHWITVHPGGTLTDQQVDELVTESNLLVVEHLPRAQRPVNPEGFGHRAQ